MDKREIRERYKQMPPDMGVYQITNLQDGKRFIGRALDLKGRLNSERFRLKNGMHSNRLLQKDYSELGEEKFSFEVLDRLAAKDGPEHDYCLELKDLEVLWLEKLQPFGARGYHQKNA